MRTSFLALFVLLSAIALDCSALDLTGPVSRISFSDNGSIAGAISCASEGGTCTLPAYNVSRPEGNCQSAYGGHYKVYYGRTVQSTTNVHGGAKYVVVNFKCDPKIAAKNYNFPCTNQFFKEDPWSGRDKYCYYRFYPFAGDSYQGVSRSESQVPGEGITCATEGKSCKPANFVGDLCKRAPKSRIEVYYGRRVENMGTSAAYQAFTIACTPWLDSVQFQCTNDYFGVDPYPNRDKSCYLRPVEVR